MTQPYLMGIDGGGTNTRVLITTLTGEFVTHLQFPHAASIHKDQNAIKNVQTAIWLALNQAGITYQEIACIVAGIAGYDKPSDLTWVSQLCDLPGLDAKKKYVNDAHIAHAGALVGKCGIIVIAGTGSVVLGLNEEGRYFRNYDFYHNAYGASRLLAYQFMQEVLAGHDDQSDNDILACLFDHFHVKNREEFVALACQGFENNAQQRDKWFGDFTPYITEHALKDSHLASKIIQNTAKNIVTGIEVVASTIHQAFIPVSLIGSVTNSKALKTSIHELLPSRFNLQEVTFSPEIGAIILAMQEMNIDITDTVFRNLQTIQQKEATHAISS